MIEYVIRVIFGSGNSEWAVVQYGDGTLNRDSIHWSDDINKATVWTSEEAAQRVADTIDRPVHITPTRMTRTVI